jgi:hypothetical protein
VKLRSGRTQKTTKTVTLRWALNRDGEWWLVEFHDGEPEIGHHPVHGTNKVWRDTFIVWRNDMPVEITQHRSPSPSRTVR